MDEGFEFESSDVGLAEEFDAAVVVAADGEVVDAAAVAGFGTLFGGEFLDARGGEVVGVAEFGHQGFDVGAVFVDDCGFAGAVAGEGDVGGVGFWWGVVGGGGVVVMVEAVWFLSGGFGWWWCCLVF